MRIDITETGAKPNGDGLNTKSIQTAIDHCYENGGGTVVVPAGEFLSGSLRLKSRVTLYLDSGAILRASGDLKDYPELPVRHNEFGVIQSFLWGVEADNVCVTGAGTLDLNDKPFLDWDSLLVDPDNEFFTQEIIDQLTPEQMMDTTVGKRERPSQSLFFQSCHNLQFEGVTILNAPCWALSISKSEDIRISRIKIDNHLRVPNADGIHLSACRDVIIGDCHFSGGDDCIAITGITSWDDVSENFIIHDCIMRSRSAGVRMGHLSSKVRNVQIHHCIIHDSNRGIAIFAGDGGWVTDVQVSHLNIETRIMPGNWWGQGEPVILCAADEASARIRNISFSHVRSRSDNSVVLVGQGNNIQDVVFLDSRFMVRYGSARPLIGGVIDLRPAKVRQAPDPRKHIPAMYADSVSGIQLRNTRFSKDESESLDFSCEPLFQNVEELVRDS